MKSLKVFNGYENYLLVKGLESVSFELKKEIEEARNKGKNHIMTTGFVDMTIAEILGKVNHLTINKNGE